MSTIEIPEATVARALAQHFHAGQADLACEDYFGGHLTRVATACEERDRAAAWLHDILEDTSCTPETLESFGISRATRDAVGWLTRDDGQPYDEFIGSIVQSTAYLTTSFREALETARRVKLQDVRDHLRNTAPLSPEQIEKYAKALYQLTG